MMSSFAQHCGSMRWSALQAAGRCAANEMRAVDACGLRMYGPGLVPSAGSIVAMPARSITQRTRRRRPIQLQALRGFESAARHLSFTLAAAELKLTQSSISRQVAALEDDVGMALFTRHTRALRLTPAGERLFSAVQQGLALIDRAVDEIRGGAGVRRVTVATYASFASLWLVPRLAEFQRLHRGIEIRIDAADRLVDLEPKASTLRCAGCGRACRCHHRRCCSAKRNAMPPAVRAFCRMRGSA
jgi:DNA-binding MarR family transcriptional regulator